MSLDTLLLWCAGVALVCGVILVLLGTTGAVLDLMSWYRSRR